MPSQYQLDSREEAEALAEHLGEGFNARLHDHERMRWGVFHGGRAVTDQHWLLNKHPGDWGFINITEEERQIAKLLAIIT